MRCTQCGMPLSPTNTSMQCPRCHTVNGVGPKSTVPLPPQHYADPSWGKPGGEQYNGQRQEQAQVGHAASVSWQGGISPQMPFPSAPLSTVEAAGRQQQVSFASLGQIPLPQAGSIGQQGNLQPAVPVALSTPSSPSIPASVEMKMWSGSDHYAIPNRIAGGMYSAPARAVRPQPPRMSNAGFIVAGLCIIVGALILIFVYVMAQTLPLTSVGTSTASRTTPVTTTHSMPSPTVAMHTPTVIASPTTGSLPGQQFIDNPQMASTVNVNTAQPLQVTNMFRVNQRIYVTFDIHPNGNNGAVCLMWYLNNRVVTQFPFAVTASARAGYSYALYGAIGTGYVEIYWASSVACTDGLLAQRVNFTVTK